jgi:membrane protease YdiL (CAAX protease family)
VDSRDALIGALLFAGVAISIWTFVPVMQGAEAARRDIGTYRLSVGMIVAVLVLNAFLTLPFRIDPASLQNFSVQTFALAALATQIPIVAVVYARLIWPHALTWPDLGLKQLPVGRVFSVGIGVGVMGLVLTIAIGLVLSQFGLRSNQNEEFGFVRGAGPVGLAVALFFGAVTAPFAEELFFRGVLFGLLSRRQPLWAAYVVSSAVFAVAHLMPMRMNPSQMAGLAVGIFVLGLLLAWTYHLTGSLYPGMLAHALNNATALVALYAATSS